MKGGSGQMQEETAKKMLTVKQAAEALCVSQGLLYKAMHQGKIPSVRILTRVLIPAYFVETLTNPPAAGKK